MSIATQIAALEAAVEAGILSVTDENGRTVRYHSLDAMMAALTALKAAQATAGGGCGFRLTPLAHGDAK